MSRPFTGRKVGLYPYSSVQVNAPAIISNGIISWGEEMISDRDIYSPPNDFIHGREDEIHITLLYGLHSQHFQETSTLMASQLSFEVELGQVSIFTTNDDFDVVKIEVNSPSLFYFHNMLKSNVPNTNCYATYRPHVTIAYIKKNLYKNLIGRKYFNGWRWTANSVIFSSTDGQKTPIRLNTLRPVLCS
jgi:2'-5' RNA ligase